MDDPSPEEIEAACLAFQATWSPAERRRRRSLFAMTLTEAAAAMDRVETPVVAVREISFADAV